MRAKKQGLCDNDSSTQEGFLHLVKNIRAEDSLLKMLLNAHSGFSRDDFQGYLDLYKSVINPSIEHLKKVEQIIESAFSRPKSLRYRNQFGKSKSP